MAENIKLYQAAENEIEEITKLYEQAKGSEYCTWDEHYPNIEITRQDLKRNDLFCMKTETGEIVGAISIDDDKEVEGLSCWSDKLKPSVEIARLVVKKEWQNKKIAAGGTRRSTRTQRPRNRPATRPAKPLPPGLRARRASSTG